MYLPTKHPVHDYKAAIRTEFVTEAKVWRTIQGAVHVGIHVWFTMPASWSRKKQAEHVGQYHAPKPDADNVMKAVLDALTDCGAWIDDSQVASVQLIKRWASKNPLTMITIKEL